MRAEATTSRWPAVWRTLAERVSARSDSMGQMVKLLSEVYARHCDPQGDVYLPEDLRLRVEAELRKHRAWLEEL